MISFKEFLLEYGRQEFWLSPDCELIKVNRHIEYVGDVIGKGHFEVRTWADGGQRDYYLDGKEVPMPDMYEYAYRKGWVRVVETSNTIHFSFLNSVSIKPKQLKFLKDLALEKGKSIWNATANRPVAENVLP
jgi:hypothetical protein